MYFSEKKDDYDRATALSTSKLNQLGITHVLNTAQAPTVAEYPPSKSPKLQNWGAIGGFVRTSQVL